MDQTQFTFQSTQLGVDWISFNAQGLENPEPIAKYLFEFGFNSVLLNSEEEQILYSDSKNLFKVVFSRYKKYWNGIIIQFSGENAAYFYRLIRQKSIDFSFFPPCRLGRLDLQYFRKAKPTDKISVNEFFKNCYEKIRQRKKRIQISIQEYMMTVGNRKSSNFYRIYVKKGGLRFELEIKNTPLKSFQDLLFSGQIEQFEAQSSEYFFKSFARIFPTSYCYMDWLAVHLRPNNNRTLAGKAEVPLRSEYIEIEKLISMVEKKHFFRLLQLLSFLQSLKSYEALIQDRSNFVRISFRVQEFLKFSGSDNYNNYQLTQVVQFFQQLQTMEPLVTHFSKTHFRSIIVFPYVEVEVKEKYWTVTFEIARELYLYQYPFLFPNFFIQYENKYDFEVKIEIIRVFSTENAEKVFDTQNFLKQYRVPNKIRTEIKQIILDLIAQLQKFEIIESHYKVFEDGLYKPVNLLTLKNISKSFIFYEKFDKSLFEENSPKKHLNR